MTLVIDAGALVAYINDEPGAAFVEQLLLGNQGDCYIHAVNLCEVYYPILREKFPRWNQGALLISLAAAHRPG